jgi:hypothetical protein
MTRSRHPLMRTALLGLGILLLIVWPFIAVLPGPGGIFVFAAALALLLQNSAWVRRRWARLMRRWPRISALVDRALRRPSARRRRLRDAGPR